MKEYDNESILKAKDLKQICTHLNAISKSACYKNKDGAWECPICELIGYDDPEVPEKEIILSYNFVKEHSNEILKVITDTIGIDENIGNAKYDIMRIAILAKLLGVVDKIMTTGSSDVYNSNSPAIKEVFILAIMMGMQELDEYLALSSGVFSFRHHTRGIIETQPMIIKIVKDINDIIWVSQCPGSKNMYQGHPFVENELINTINLELSKISDEHIPAIYNIIFGLNEKEKL